LSVRLNRGEEKTWKSLKEKLADEEELSNGIAEALGIRDLKGEP